MSSSSYAVPEGNRTIKASETYAVDFDLNITDNRYFAALARFDINFAHLIWVYDNVRRNSSVLDIGCAGAMLGLLKRKDAHLAGVAPNTQRARAAHFNGYDAACAARPSQLPYLDASFDHVVSFETFNGFTSEEMNSIVAEAKRVLRRGGTMLLGIRRQQVADAREDENAWRTPSSSPSPEVWAEDYQEKQIALLRSHFAHVIVRARNALCLSSAEFLREADKLSFPVEEDFLGYVRGLSFRERRAFDMAMGYVYDKLNQLQIETPENDFYIFARGSDQPFTSSGDERRERARLLNPASVIERASVRLDEAATFDEGWHESRDLPPRARLMSERGRVRFVARYTPQKIRLDLITHMPDLKPRGLTLDLFLNDSRACSFTLFRRGWLELEITVPLSAHNAGNHYELEIRADRTWAAHGDAEHRRYSVAVCNIEALMEKKQ